MSVAAKPLKEMMHGEQELEQRLAKSRRQRNIKESLTGYAVIFPWLIGFFGLTVGPVFVSLYLAFTNYNIISTPSWIGIDNFVRILTNDPRFWTSVRVTLTFVFVSVPLRLAVALVLAVIFKKKRRGTGFFTTVYYIPSIIGGSVAIAVVWRQLFSINGVINAVLGVFGFEPYAWLVSTNTALGVLILLSLWQFGSPMIIFLAGLRQIPKELYEAASIDGASSVSQFFKITLPMLSPVIFFNLVMQMIGGFMVFNSGFLITQGGPLDSTLFYAIYLYRVGFQYLRMGYASAMAWILLVIIGFFTALVFKSQKHWVHYTGE